MTPPPRCLVLFRVCGLSTEEIAESLGVSVARARSIVARPELAAACAAAEDRIRTSLRREIADETIDALDELYRLAGHPPFSVDPDLVAEAVSAAIEADPEARFSDPEPLRLPTVAAHSDGKGSRLRNLVPPVRELVRMHLASDPEGLEMLIRLGGSNSPN